MKNLAELLSSYEKILLLELDKIRVATDHTTQKGDHVEKLIRKLLTDFLPKKIGVSEGKIINSDGYISPQLDVILYDQLKSFYFHNTLDDGTKIIPIEYVFAVGEIKSQLTLDNYKKFDKTQQNIKNSQRFYKKNPKTSWTYHGYGKDWNKPFITSFIIALKGPTNSIYQFAQNAHLQRPINSCIDMTFCIDNYVICRSSEYGLDLAQGTMEKLNCISQHSLFIAFGLLFKAAEYWEIYENPEIYRYFTQYDEFSDSLVTDIDPKNVEHKDLKS